MGLPAYPDVHRTFLIPFVAFASFPLAGGCFHKADDHTAPAANQGCAGRCLVEGGFHPGLESRMVGGWCGVWDVGYWACSRRDASGL